MKNNESIILRDLSEDYAKASDYITEFFRSNNVSHTMISETLFVFEALCYKIFEQKKPKNEVELTGLRRLGDSTIEIRFVGEMFDPDPEDPSMLTPEERIMKAYADKIDYSYRNGRNVITITSKRNHLASVSFYAVNIVIGIILYSLLRYTAPESVQFFAAEYIVYPLESIFLNAILMVGTPLTFASMLKHLTDTYVLSESHSYARRLSKSTIISSVISVALAILSSSLITALLFSDNPLGGKYSHGSIKTNPMELANILVPSDIFTPFQTAMPYAMIILAVLTTYAFCSVGKYFDLLKNAIDAVYVLFERMLSIVMYALPLYALLGVMDELFSDGFKMLLYLTEMIVVAFASLGVLFVYYIVRLKLVGIHAVPFIKSMIPLLRENAGIASAFDAVPYNIRYCVKTFGFDRKRLDQSMPVLAQINLDGNCFIITMLSILYISINSTPLSMGTSVVVGILVMLLSLGAPNQPGSCLVGLAIVMIFLDAVPLETVAIIGEVMFGGILNLTNISGDIVTIAAEEVHANGSADKLNKILERKENAPI